MRPSECLSAYLQAKQNQNLRPASISTYRRELIPLIKHLTRQKLSDLDNLEPHHIQSWLSSMLARGVSGASVRQRRVLVLMWLNWLHDHGYCDSTDWGRRIDPIEADEPVPHFLSRTEALALIEAARRASRYPLVSVRNPAIVSLFLDTGLRRGELAGLLLSDVDLVGKYVLVRSSAKSRVSRICPFGTDTLRLLRGYLRERQKLYPEHSALWLSRVGEPLRENGIHHVVADAGKVAGIRHPHCHALRHTCCTMLADAGMPIHLVAEQMGHKRLRTTQRYIHGSGTELRARYGEYGVVDRLGE